MIKVSIPFKREGTGERRYERLDNRGNRKFQFPSNGKARVNMEETTYRNREEFLVSIPFKREGTGERYEEVPVGSALMAVSIPFKREGTGER